MNLFQFPGIRLPLAAVLMAAAAVVVHAEPAHKLVAQGNEAYEDGDYEKALSLYEEASVELPESAQVYFNRGTVLYKQEDYEKAIENFKDAALRSVEPALSSRAKFNLGNCAFRQAGRQRDSDLKKAIEHCQEAISYYQEARDLDRSAVKAAENIEIVRLYIKVLLDEQKKQQEQEEQEENLVQKLQKLIERQNGLIKQNGELAAQKPDGVIAEETQRWKESVQELGSEQGVLRDDTRSVLEEIGQTRSQIEQQAAQAAQGQDPNQPQSQAPGQPQPQPQPQGQPQPSPEEMKAMGEKFGEAAGHVTNAIASEGAAKAQLAAVAQDTAAKNQEAAARSLEEAVKALADPNQQQQQQDGDQQQEQDDQQEGDQQQKQDQSQEGGQEEPEEGENEQEGEEEKQEQQDQPQEDGKSEEEEERQARLEQAEDILDEEKKQRRPVRPLRGAPVDRDW